MSWQFIGWIIYAERVEGELMCWMCEPVLLDNFVYVIDFELWGEYSFISMMS